MKAALIRCLLFLLLGLTVVLGAENRHGQPNILFIISDDQGWSDYGFMDHPRIATPNLDQLAKRSITFKRAYSAVPLCRPSLASIVTGLYPHQHGVTGNDPELPEKGLNAMAERSNPEFRRYYETVISNFEKHPNLVRELTSKGYMALQTGKWWEGDPIKTCGFTHAMTAGEGKKDRHGGAGLAIGRQGLEPITRFIDEAGPKPWLVWYAPMLPHAPHNPPADLLQKYLKVSPTDPVARYWACVEWFDHTCGDLLDQIQKRGMREKTIVLYVCDNGWIQNPQISDKCSPRSKLSPYEGGVRTPIMVSWPGTLKPRMDEAHLASSLDLWPTLAALTGMQTPKNLPGINLTDERAVKRRTKVFGEQYAHNIADVDHPTRSLETRYIVDGWWKVIVPDPRNQPGAPSELYDLRKDPWEKNDLSVQQSARLP